MSRIIAAAVVLISSGTLAVVYAQALGESTVKQPNEIEWKAPAVAPGPSTAVLVGDPSKAGVYVTRLKLPAGMKLQPHTHPDEWRTAVVLAGTLYYGYGEQWDDGKLKAYPAGTFFTEPKNTPHFVSAKDGEVIVQITGMGPTGTVPVAK
jgi:quercetin dioxygenase-like cupin family protein